MSEQHAENLEEEFDSANSRLDSILDQLNALGSGTLSAGAETDESIRPTRALRSVPDLESLTPPALPDVVSDIDSPVAHSDAEIVEVAQVEIEEVAPVEHVEVAQVEIEEVAPVQHSNDAPTVAEYHEIEITTPPEPEIEHVVPSFSVVEPPPVPDGEAPTRAGDDLVFMLDGPLETEQPQNAAPEFPPSATTNDVDSGWVSHHEEEPEVLADLDQPVVEDTDQKVAEPSFDAPEWDEAPTELAPEHDETDDLFGQAVHETSAEELEFFDAEIASGLTDLEDLMSSADVNTSDDEQVAEDVTSGSAPTEFSIASESAVEGEDPTGYEALFETDEELPLPDFTGVWADEDSPGTVWDQDDAAQISDVPVPVEDGGHRWGISVGRNELDSLRPVEEEDVAIAQPTNVARKLQLVMVVLFGLIALAVIFLDDPAVVDDLREIYDGFFG